MIMQDCNSAPIFISIIFYKKTSMTTDTILFRNCKLVIKKILKKHILKEFKTT